MSTRTAIVGLIGAFILATAHAARADVLRTIFLVRHGAYDDATADNVHAPLTPLGVVQSRLVAERFQLLSDTVKLVASSTMTRALQTSIPIREANPHALTRDSDLFRECTPPYVGDYAASPDTRADERLCAIRLNKAFAAYFTPATGPETDIIVCHGNVIRYFVMKALGADPTLWAKLSVGHASVTEVQVHSDGTMRVISVGDVGHIPLALQSGSGQATPQLTAPPIGR